MFLPGKDYVIVLQKGGEIEVDIFTVKQVVDDAAGRPIAVQISDEDGATGWVAFHTIVGWDEVAA